MKSIRLTHFFACGLLVFALPCVSAQTELPKRPNIIVILADDMGFSDIGCFGSEIPTPNLDALAADGIRFTEFHNMSRCCPSRATLLTGLYPHQAGIGMMNGPRFGLPSYQGYLNQQCVTEAQVLDPAGYFTALVGKWHVGMDRGAAPWERGFTRSLASPKGEFYWSDDPITENYLDGKKVGAGDLGVPTPWYITDVLTTYSLKFIDEAEAAKKPFYLYLAETAPHFYLQAPTEEIEKFRHGIYQQGWDKLREARYEKEIKLGVIDKDWALSPRDPRVVAWDSLTPQKKEDYDTIMAAYAAVITHLDTQIGVLVDGLKKRGLYDNTVIFFLSDNGANLEGKDGWIQPKKQLGQGKIFLGRSWANLGNDPLRYYKHYEQGGTASPFIVHWPDGIKAKGELRPQLSHLIDIMPTVADLAGATYPTTFNGNKILPEEGVSLVPAFNDATKPLARTQPLFWEHEGNRAINDGKWKLVRLTGKDWELYDYYADRTELHDLAKVHPDIVAKLSAEWQAWGARVGVVGTSPELKPKNKSEGTKSAKNAKNAPVPATDVVPSEPAADD